MSIALQVAIEYDRFYPHHPRLRFLLYAGAFLLVMATLLPGVGLIRCAVAGRR